MENGISKNTTVIVNDLFISFKMAQPIPQHTLAPVITIITIITQKLNDMLF